MAERLLNYETEVSMTVTSLHSLASSATAGWCSVAIDNSTNLFVDTLVQFTFDPVDSGTIANAKGVFCFCWGAGNTGDYPTTGASSGGTVGTEGALTFPDILTLPNQLKLLELVPINVNTTLQKSVWFSVASRFGGWMPKYFGFACLNYCGIALHSANNAVKYTPVTETIA